MFDNKVSIEYMAVSMPLNEDFYEQVIIEHLRDDLGYEFLHGPDVPRTTADYRDVFLPIVLPNSLKRINPELPSVAIEQAILKISNIDAGGLYQKNEIFNDYLQSGVEVHFFDGKEERDDIVYLLDYENPLNNSFHVVNQWTFVEYSQKRPDLVVFVNGMPLVIFELKSPSREETDASDAYKQLRQYMKHIPSMFVPNAICVMSDLTETRVGTITAKEDRYVAWKSVDGDYSGTEHADLKTMLDGMLAKERLIDIVHNFVCFNDSAESVVKILAGYHQYFAVRKAAERAVEAVSGDGMNTNRLLVDGAAFARLTDMYDRAASAQTALRENVPSGKVVYRKRFTALTRLLTVPSAMSNLARNAPNASASRSIASSLSKLER